MGCLTKDSTRNAYMLNGLFDKQGYDWWWHSFTGVNTRTGEEKTFFIEYFLINPALGMHEPILGQLPMNQKRHIYPSYLMIKAGCWGENAMQLHRFFAWNQVQVHEHPYCVATEDCIASDQILRGAVDVSREEAKAHPEWMCDAGSMQWDLKLEHIIPFNVGYGAGRLFRKLKAFEMYWNVSGMKTIYSGTVICNGEEYQIRTHNCYGYADKNWGRDFTTPWVWLSSCDLYSKIRHQKLENSAFDIGGGKPKVFGISLNRKLLSAFCYEGTPYEFNFSKFWTGTFTKFACKETDTELVWHVRQETTKAVMDTVVHCNKKEMLLVNYESPKGEMRHTRLWNGGTGTGRIKLYEKQGKELVLIDEIIAKHVGCEYGEFDHNGRYYR